MSGEDCPLCRIARHELESRIIYEDEHTVGVVDIRPRFAKGQCVVFPKIHVPHVYDLEDEDGLRLFQGIKVVAKKIERLYNPEHVSIFVRGRTFPHAHAILFPSISVDKDMLSQFLRPMMLFSPLEGITEAELDDIAARLRSL
ncbi:MAG: HIT family protein [Chloroflexi bacterium]|nr:HIT family protein [Chloroflexota bacterium]